jgi:hypothetical protein
LTANNIFAAMHFAACRQSILQIFNRTISGISSIFKSAGLGISGLIHYVQKQPFGDWCVQ